MPPPLLRRAGRRAAVLNLDMVLMKPVPSIHHLCCIISQRHTVYTVPTVSERMTNSLMSLYFWRRLIFLLLWVNTANLTSCDTAEAANDSVNYNNSASNKLPRQSYFAILCDLWRWANALDGTWHLWGMQLKHSSVCLASALGNIRAFPQGASVPIRTPLNSI